MIRPLSIAPGVYAITPDGLPADEIERRAARLAASGIRLLQLRSKHLDAEARLQLARRLLPICSEHTIPLIINDNPTIAQQVGAAGVHLGRDDGELAAARALLGPDAWIGVSCYADPQRARRLADSGASYVAFGAVYPSQSKQTGHRAPLQLFRDWSSAGVPSVAIGGLNADNAAPVVAAGARWLAMIGALWGDPDPAGVVRRINRLYRSPAETQAE